MDVKFTVIPGKIFRLSVPEGATVVDVATQMNNENNNIDYVRLINERTVHVNGKIFSVNSEQSADGSGVGNIASTPLNEGDAVLVTAKIKGNNAKVGCLFCFINGEEYSLESPDTIFNTLDKLTDIYPDDVTAVRVNGNAANINDLVCDEDIIEVELSGGEEDDDDGEDDDDYEDDEDECEDDDNDDDDEEGEDDENDSSEAENEAYESDDE